MEAQTHRIITINGVDKYTADATSSNMISLSDKDKISAGGHYERSMPEVLNSNEEWKRAGIRIITIN